MNSSFDLKSWGRASQLVPRGRFSPREIRDLGMSWEDWLYPTASSFGCLDLQFFVQSRKTAACKPEPSWLGRREGVVVVPP